MRPIYWGVIWFFIGMIGWVAFSVVYGVIGGFSGSVPPAGYVLVDLFGSLFFFSLPVAVVAEIVRWRRNKTKSAASIVPDLGRAGQRGEGLMGSPASCPRCGTRIDPRMWYCPNCHARLATPTPDVTVASKKPHSKVKWMGVGVSVFIILMILGAAFAPTHPATTTFTVPPSSPYRIEVTKVVVDHSYYLLTVDASYSGDGSWNVYPFNFQLVSNSSSVYPPVITLSEKTPLSDVTLSNGQHDVGQIAFDLPNGEIPSKLEYLSKFPSIKVETTIPQVSSWMSTVSFAEVSVRNVNGLSPFATGTIQSIGPYYTGEVVVVKVTVRWVGLSSISVTAISDSDGFMISKIEPSLPLTVKGNGQEVDIVVSLVAPPSSYSGNLHLTVTVSS
jgi:hypothetical protein